MRPEMKMMGMSRRSNRSRIETQISEEGQLEGCEDLKMWMTSSVNV